jgi:hypothetical protein
LRRHHRQRLRSRRKRTKNAKRCSRSWRRDCVSSIGFLRQILQRRVVRWIVPDRVRRGRECRGSSARQPQVCRAGPESRRCSQAHVRHLADRERHNQARINVRGHSLHGTRQSIDRNVMNARLKNGWVLRLFGLSQNLKHRANIGRSR